MQVKKEYWNNQKRIESKDFESSNAQGCVPSTSNDGNVSYSKAIMVAKGRKQLFDFGLIDLGAT